MINRLYTEIELKRKTLFYFYTSHFYSKFLKESPFEDNDENVIKNYLKNNYLDDLLRFLEYRYFFKKYNIIKIKGRDVIDDNLLLQKFFDNFILKNYSIKKQQ